MVKFEFDIDKARKALGDISKGSEKVTGTLTPRRPDVVIPGHTPEEPRKRESAKEAKTPSRSDEMQDLKDEIKDLKSRIRRLESEIDK